MPNEFSPQWFDNFLHTVPEAATAAEVAGVMRRLPLPEFPRVLDVCCGAGRHAAALVLHGYEITGVDRDEKVLRHARAAAPGATFHALDQRDLRALTGPFDAVVILWQSFGYFDSATNDRVLADIASLLRPSGRLLLDLFHPDSFAVQDGTALPASRGAEGILITNSVTAGRLRSEIRFPDGAIDIHEFELFSPRQLEQRAAKCGLHVIEQCCWWDEARPPDPAVRRYQTVLERRV